MYTVIRYELRLGADTHRMGGVYLTFESGRVLEKLYRDSRVSAIVAATFEDMKTAREMEADMLKLQAACDRIK